MKRAAAFALMIGFSVGFLLIEMFLRVDDYSSLATDYAYHDWDGRIHRVMATSDDLADPRRPIVVLGDSMVAGINCGRDQNLVGHFETAMQSIADGYKTINLGSANSSVFSYLDQFRSYRAANGPPSGVIVVLYANDVDVIESRMCPVADVIERSDRLTAADKSHVREFCRDAPAGLKNSAGDKALLAIGGPVDAWLHDASYAYRFFREALVRIVHHVGDGEPVGRLRYPVLWSDPESQAFRLMAVGLSEIKAIADRDGIPLMVAVYPPIEFLSRDNPMYAATEIGGRVFGKLLGLSVLNGFDAYLDDPRATANMARSLTDLHPTCEAHQILAEWLVQKFDQAGGFGQGSPDRDLMEADGGSPALLALPVVD